MSGKKVIFVAMNAKMFRLRELVTKFAFEHGVFPINCLMLYGYYLYDMVPRVKIIEGYKAIVPKCDEFWIFGDISDGVRDGMIIAKKNNMPIRFFDLSMHPKIFEISEDEAVYEDGVNFG